MGIQLKNNATSLLASAITSTDTTVVVSSGTGGLFPSLGASDYFYATLSSSSGYQEIVKVTARADDTMTVLRAQESTTALPFPTGSRFEIRVTVQNILSNITDLDYLIL
jgi:hypothetical protein